MRYVAPINAPDEARQLVRAGADELYCGYQDAWWTERYGDHDSASRRQGAANLSTRDELARTTEEAAKLDAPLYLALNARYTEMQLDYLMGLCTDFERWGGTGVIVSDLGLLWRLKQNSALDLCLSLLAVVQNAPTLAAYRSLGVTRVVLPRFLDPDAAGSLLSAVPDMQGEVMAFFDKCPLVDGYCRHRHGVSYPDRNVEAGHAKSPDNAPPLFTFDTTYRTHACLGTTCDYLDPYPCAACHLPLFEREGIGFAKIGGRGRPLEERLRALKFLKRAETLATDAQRIELYQETFGQDCSCYFGPCIQSRHAIEPVEIPADIQRRAYVGSQTSVASFEKSLDELRNHGSDSCFEPVTLMVPPLSDAHLETLASSLPELAANHPSDVHLCVNDLGTLITATRVASENNLNMRVTMGTLLARIDDEREVAHFLSENENPPRAVWGPRGEPRMLAYRRPPATLVEHWSRPSATEPSAQAALAMLTGTPAIPYEFAK